MRIRLSAALLALSGAALLCGIPAAVAQGKLSESEREMRLSERVSELARDGRYPDALAAADSLLALRRRIIAGAGEDPRGHPWIAAGYVVLAGLYDEVGDVARADSLYREEIDQGERGRGPEDPEVVSRRFHLALRYQEQGRHALADSLFAIVVKRAQAALGAETVEMYRQAYDQGRFASDAREDERQEELFQQMADAGHTEPAIALGDSMIERLRQQLEDPAAELSPGLDAETAETYRQALEISLQMRLSSMLGALAGLYEQQGMQARADTLRREAADRYARVVALLPRPYDDVLGDSGSILAAIRDSVAARPAAAPRPATAADTLEALIQHLRSVTDQFEHLLASQDTSYMDIPGWTEQVPLRGAYAYAAVALNVGTAPEQPDLAHLALDLLLRHKGSEQNRAADLWRRILRAPEGVRGPALDTLAALRTELSALVSRSTAPADSTQRRAAFARLDVRHAALEQRLQGLPGLPRPDRQRITPEEVQAALPPGGVLVELVWYDPSQAAFSMRPGVPRGYAAYVLRRDGSPEMVDLGPAASLDSLVRRFSATLANPASADARTLARALERC